MGILVLIVFLASGCFPGGSTYRDSSPAGFFSGVWHGWIAPVSLVLGLFNDSIRIYEPNNTGWMYDFGFYVAIIGGFGGLSLTRDKLKGRSRHE